MRYTNYDEADLAINAELDRALPVYPVPEYSDEELCAEAGIVPGICREADPDFGDEEPF